MPTLPRDPAESAAPSIATASAARESARLLARSLPKTADMVQLRVDEPDAPSEPVAVPAEAFRLLLTILSKMADGNAVRVISDGDELSTGDAAEMLNVSRPYVIKLLDEGHIPSHRVGTHRRVRAGDVLAYRDEHFRARKGVLDRMAAIDQELGLT
jgi:excisionase family DNA binding protein